MSEIKYKLQGHQKFPLRDGWISKVLRFDFDSNPKIFNNLTEATDQFGIGSVMVKSMRYWTKTLGITKEGNGNVGLTDFGRFLLEKDPDIEKLNTIWILHSRLVKNKEEATTWNLFFSSCNAQGLTREQIKVFLAKELRLYIHKQEFSVSSLDNDVDTLLNMYLHKDNIIDPEDTTISPFSSLNLISCNRGIFEKNVIPRNCVSKFLLLYEIYARLRSTSSISIQSLSKGVNGVSFLYQISDQSLDELLDELESDSFITINRTAGLNVIYLKNKDLCEHDVLRLCYD